MTDTLDHTPATPPPALLLCAVCRWPHIFTSANLTNLPTESAAWWCSACSPQRPRDVSRADAASRAIPFPRRLIALFRRRT